MEPLVLPLLEIVHGLDRFADVVGSGGLLIAAGILAAAWNHWLGRRSYGIAAAAKPPSGPAAKPGTKPAAKSAKSRPAGQSGFRLPSALYSQSGPHYGALRSVLRSLTVLGVMSTAALIAAEHFGSAPLLRWSLSKLQAQSGIQFTFEEATGGPLSGQFVLHKVRVQRANDPHSNFDLNASEITLRFSMWKLIRAQIAFDELRIEQVTGAYQRVGKFESPGAAEKAPRTKSTEKTKENTAEQAGQASKNVLIRRFQVKNATIDYQDSVVEGEPIQFVLAIKSLTCAPFRTEHAPFDIVFRSEVEGTLDQHPIRIASKKVSNGKQTEWQATGIPVKFARAYLGGPFRWLTAGECDLQVKQTVLDNPRAPVIVETRMGLRNIRAGAPPNVKPAVAIAAQLLISQIKRFPKEKAITFKLRLDPDKFDLTQTEDVDRLWQQFREAAIAALIQSTGLKSGDGTPEGDQKVQETVIDITDTALDALKLLEGRRPDKEKKVKKSKR